LELHPRWFKEAQDVEEEKRHWYVGIGCLFDAVLVRYYTIEAKRGGELKNLKPGN